MPDAAVSTEMRGRTALMTIYNPPANTLSPKVAEALRGELDDVRRKGGARSIVLTGTGRFFVAGGDLGHFRTLDPVSAERHALRIHEVQAMLRNLPLPVIAAVNGYALGGGCELMLACDTRIADEEAVFGLPEVGLGVIPGAGGTQLLARLVGQGMARRMVFSGERIGAREALARRLVEEVVPAGMAVDAALELAEKVNANAPKAIAAAKQSLNLGAQMPLQDALCMDAALFGSLFHTADTAEGIAAFLEKRSPDFRGE